MKFEEIRSEFPVTKKYVYLNHASVGPLPQRVLNACVKANVEKYYGEVYWSKWQASTEEMRKSIARFINAHVDEIALTPNTSEGISIVANGIDWKTGDKIVTSDLEFTSNLFPWQNQAMRHCLQLEIIANKNERLLMEDFENRINGDTRIVAVSHVQFSNGFKINLEKLSKLAHENNAYVITDAVQSLGQMPVDVKRLGVDFLATSGYKWLLSPIATGFFYIKKDLIDELGLSFVGYRSTEDYDDYSFREFKPAESARRFEHGQLNFPGFAGMHEAIRLLEELGLDRIEKRVTELTNLIIETVQEKGKGVRVESAIEPEQRSGILKLACKDPEKVEQKLRRKRIIISVRRGGLRVSPHFYNTPEEIEKFLSFLYEFGS